MAQYVADVLSSVYFARKCNLRVQYLGMNKATLCFLSTYVIALKPNASIFKVPHCVLILILNG